MKLNKLLKICLAFACVLSVHSSPPVFKCVMDMDGSTCNFFDIKLNSSHFEWIPEAGNSLLVKNVRFHGSVIPVLTKNICEAFPALEDLNVYYSGVQEINEDALHACSELTTFAINNNEVKKLHTNTFLHTKKMQMISLMSNNIEKLEDNLFINMSNLTNLDIHENKLTEFSPELLRNNPKLEEFCLCRNNLTDIDAERILNMLPKLRVFWLDHNDIPCKKMEGIQKSLKAQGRYCFISTDSEIKCDEE